LLLDTWFLFTKYVRITIRMPWWSLFTLLQPLIWLLIFGQLFGNMTHLPGFPTNNYDKFFMPGVLIMTVLFGSSWSGVSLLREITSGTVDKLLVAPISRTSIVLSRILHSAVQVIAQSLLILLLAWAIGAASGLGFFSLIQTMLIILLLGLSFAAISNGLAIHLQREEPLVMIGNLMTLPLMFLSSALVPKDFMPTWIQYIALINPIDYAVEAVRSVLLVNGAGPAAYAKGLGLLGIFAAATIAWAVSAFNAERD
jgi:ABC-2 type transport system permease protein